MGCVVSCAGDYDLARRVYSFLLSTYQDAANTNRISLLEDEISVQNEQLGIKKDGVRKALIEFRESNKDLEGYAISDFGDTFTIGIQESLDKLILSCDICGYLSQHEEELNIHKRIHGLLSIS